MTERTMIRHALLLLALGSLSLLTQRAHAQTTTGQTATSGNVQVQVEGDEDPLPVSSPQVYINRSQCERDFRFELTGYVSGQAIPELEAWVSPGAEADCSTAQARARGATGIESKCWLAGTLSGVSGNPVMVIPGRRIFDRTNVENDLSAAPKNCPKTSNSPYRVWFVPLSNATSTNSTSPPEALPALRKLYVTFTLWSTLPEPPSGVSASPGESEIPVSWTSTATDTRTTYTIFVDTAPSAGSGAGMDGGVDIASDAGTSSSCSSTALLSNPETATDNTSDTKYLPPVEGTANIRVIRDISGRKTFIKDLDSLATNAEIAISVATVDPAGNIGYLSTPVCATRIPTDGLIDRCNAPGSDCGELSSCSVSPGSRGSLATLFGMGAALAALLARRRRA